MTLKAETAERLVPPREPAAPARNRRFAAVLAACFLLHMLLLAILLREDQAAAPAAPPVEEIPVELVTEIPPVEKVEPPPPPPPNEKTPKQKVKDDEKPAFDAPRATNKDTIEREAPDKETQSPRVAPPTKQTATKPAPAKAPPAAQEAETEATPQDAPPKPADDTPDAEPLDKAEPEPQVKPQEKPAAKAKAPPVKAPAKSVADQLAALSALPDYRVGAASKPAPVTGGTANTTYLSILFGLIMRQMHVPPAVRASHMAVEGIVAFYVDEMGHLTHQAVYRASGRPDLDAAALAAVRNAAPFPAPPRGDPHAIWFHYDTR